MAETMRASVLVDVGALEVQSVPRPVPGPRDVLVGVQAVGLCGTDFHIYSGESNYHLDEDGAPIPLRAASQILGHEITGTVEEIGAEVADLKVGDRVVLDQGLNCSSTRRSPRCEYCASGDSHQCEWYEEHGITGLPGGLAEYLAIPAVNAVPIESGLEPAVAALTEPLGCVLHSTDRASRSGARFGIGAADPGRRVRSAVVLGAGPAGLLFLQVLRRVQGFDGALFVSEPDPAKRRLAEGFGATTLDPASQDVVAEVRERTGGRMAEYLVEATGAGFVFDQVPRLIRKQATVLQYGIGHGGASLELLNPVQWKEPTFVLSVGASGGFDPDGRPSIYRQALRLLESGTIHVEQTLTHRYPGLESVPDAFAGDHAEPGYVKGVALLDRG